MSMRFQTRDHELQSLNEKANQMSMHEGLPVAGYRSQTTTAINRVNGHKIVEERVLRIIDTLQQTGEGDPRWLAIARTDLEKGFMALNRAVFQPGRISIPGEDEAPVVPEL